MSSAQQTYTYHGTAYRQNTAPGTPWILSFVATAEQLLEWAGIPRRSDDNMAGFQRGFDDERVAKAKTFFDMPHNQSPTAIIVGLHPSDASVIGVTLDDEHATICNCVLTVRHVPNLTADEAVPMIRRQLSQRLASDSAPDANAESVDGGEDMPDGEPATETESESLDGEDGEDAEEAAESDDDGEVELGRSLLYELSRRLDDPDWRAANAEALLDMAKPATIIDGQHRLKGAEQCERGIPFTVCALWNCAWAEQVFQFTVVNYTQKGIPDQFITANAALSLTRDELQFLQTRLIQAGVDVVEYDLMKVVQFHDDSPFKDLVNLTERKDHSKIGYKTMVRLANTWYGAKHPVFRVHILPQLFPGLPRAANRKRLTQWKNDWGSFFLDFWRIVHDTYASHPSHAQGHTLWTVGHSNLIVAIVLYEFQQAFFDNLNAQDEEFFLPKATDPEAIREELRDKLRRRAKKFVEYFSPDFFGRKWGFSSLSIGPGRLALQDTFQKIVIHKGHYQYEKSALITGQTA